MTAEGTGTTTGRWLESQAVAAACLVFAVTADARWLALALVVASIAPALTSRRLDAGTNVQLVLAALALAGAWWFGTLRAEGLPGGSRALHPIVAGTALFALLVAIPRLTMAAPWGGRRATAGYSLFAVLACGGALHGLEYPIFALGYGVIQWAALNAVDPGRLGWRGLTARTRVLTAVALGITAATAALIAIALPALHDLALSRFRGLFVSDRTGFGLHLQLGSLRGMLASNELVLRVSGPAPALLRGVVWDRYLDGRWATAHGGTARRLAGPADRGGAVDADLPPGPEVTEVRTLGGDRERLFLPLEVAALGSPDGPVRGDHFGVVYPPADTAAGVVRFLSGPRAVAPVGDATAADLSVPTALRRSLERVDAAWGVDGADPARDLVTIRARFQAEFRYSLDFRRRPGHDPVLDFLERDREGHCEYFASAAALLLRAAGVPTRVVGGYRVTERNPLGGFHVVREANAHAWVEVWMDGEGWRTFDPTPAAPLFGLSRTETTGFGAALDAFAAWVDDLVDRLPRPTATEWVVFGVGPLLLVLVWSRWRARRRRTQGAPERPAGRYEDPLPAVVALLAALAEAGERRSPSEPLETFAERVRGAPSLGASGPLAAALLGAYTAWRYGAVGDGAAVARAIESFLAADAVAAPPRAC